MVLPALVMLEHSLSLATGKQSGSVSVSTKGLLLDFICARDHSFGGCAVHSALLLAFASSIRTAESIFCQTFFIDCRYSFLSVIDERREGHGGHAFWVFSRAEN